MSGRPAPSTFFVVTDRTSHRVVRIQLIDHTGPPQSDTPPSNATLAANCGELQSIDATTPHPRPGSTQRSVETAVG